jgi:hypothetical protein
MAARERSSAKEVAFVEVKDELLIRRDVDVK